MAAHEDELKMTIDLNVLNHLGIRLYSNVAAVLSEAVANSWDADARNVTVTYDSHSTEPSIIIEDDGCGMNRSDVISKYLRVGHERRKGGKDTTDKLGRKVMGRKGIGKLSLLSIAERVEVHTKTSDGEPTAFVLDRDDMKKAAESGEFSEYKPEELDPVFKKQHGTRIVLTGLKKRFTQSETWLRRRLARRFTVIGPANEFAVSVNGDQIGISERGYLQKLEFAWWYGVSEELKAAANGARDDRQESRQLSVLVDDDRFECEGWIGTTAKSGKEMEEDGESINRITLIVRGKVAHENLLMHLGETGHYAAYLVGEVHADFLDDTQKDDIATSNRQQIDEKDPRFQGLLRALSQELNHVQSRWQEWRRQDGARSASEFPSIRTWFNSLGRDSRKKAERIFGLINRVTGEELDDRRELYKNAVIAFETLQARDQLDHIDSLEETSAEQLMAILNDIEDVEASRYYTLVRERYRRVQSLQELVDRNSLEREIQRYLFEHIWLVNPAWERATEDEYIEKTLATLAKDADPDGKLEAEGKALSLTKEHLRQRLDVKFRLSHGKHIIVELKRPDVVVSEGILTDQCNDYRSGVKAILERAGKGHEAVEVLFLTGQKVKGWDTPAAESEARAVLATRGIFVYHYEELLEQAQAQNQAFLDAMKETGRVSALLDSIDTEVPRADDVE